MEANKEAIKRAYGSDWEKVKEFVNTDGWCQMELVQDDDGDIIKCGEGHIFKESEIKYCINSIERCPKCNSIVANYDFHYRFIETSEDAQKRFGEWRPKILQGIEDNNGWTKIESSGDLPKETGWYDFQNFPLKHNAPNLTYWPKDSTKIDWFAKNYTHYRKFEKPKPPIY